MTSNFAFATVTGDFNKQTFTSSSFEGSSLYDNIYYLFVFRDFVFDATPRQRHATPRNGRCLRVDACLTGADMNSIRITSCEFKDCNLSQANLANVLFKKVDFVGCVRAWEQTKRVVLAGARAVRLQSAYI